MAECIIARGGGASNANSELPPVIVGYCQIVCNVTDSEGSPLIGFDVRCKDGDTWYNYTTNEKGQALFVTNSGSANITAYNFSSNSNVKYIDQTATSVNIDAPVTTSKYVNMTLGKQSSFAANNDNSSDIMNSCYRYVYFRVANKIDELRVGGGGGGGGSGWGETNRNNFGGGGGGGGCTVVKNIVINKSMKYNFSIGSGGRGAYFTNSTNMGSFIKATSGGSSAGFGYSASGGSGASNTSNSTSAAGGYPGGGQGISYRRGSGFNNESEWLNCRNATSIYAGGGGGCGSIEFIYDNFTLEELFEIPSWGGVGMNSGGNGGYGGYQKAYVNNGDNYRQTGRSGYDGSYGGGGGGGGGCVVGRTTASNGEYYDNGASWYWGQNGGNGSIYLSFS